MKTYARYTYTNDSTARMIGNGWHIVEKEYIKHYPSGKHNTITINGVSVKAKYCEIVQVF